MPVHRGEDKEGPYYQWGDSGKKYHYESGDKASRKKAKKQAHEQGYAIEKSMERQGEKEQRGAGAHHKYRKYKTKYLNLKKLKNFNSTGFYPPWSANG